MSSDKQNNSTDTANISTEIPKSKASEMHVQVLHPYINVEKTSENIRTLATDRGLTAHQIWQRIGTISEQAIYKWFRGESVPALENLYALKVVLGVKTIDEIIVVDNLPEETDSEI